MRFEDCTEAELRGLFYLLTDGHRYGSVSAGEALLGAILLEMWRRNLLQAAWPKRE